MAEKLLEKILPSIYVSDVVQAQELVYVTAGETLSVAAQRLESSGISSLPVFSKKSAEKKEGLALADCLGIVDFSDIATAIIDLKEKGYTERNLKKHIWKQFEFLTVEKCIKFNVSKYVQISMKSTLLEAIEKCAEFGLRRMLAVDDDQNVVAVLSPSEMIKHIIDAVDKKLDHTLSKSITELSIGTSPVITATKNTVLMRAFHTMKQGEVSAIAVVDDQTGMLHASVSMSDIALIIKEQKSGHLNSSTWKYITHKKDQEVNERFPFFSVMPEAKLSEVMSRMLATNVHHLYVVDDAQKPVKVVGFSDICRGLLTYRTHSS